MSVLVVYQHTNNRFHVPAFTQPLRTMELDRIDTQAAFYVTTSGKLVLHQRMCSEDNYDNLYVAASRKNYKLKQQIMTMCMSLLCARTTS